MTIEERLEQTEIKLEATLRAVEVLVSIIDDKFDIRRCATWQGQEAIADLRMLPSYKAGQ